VNAPSATRRDAAAGFALLVLLGIIGAGSLAVVLAVQACTPPWSERAKLADDSLATVQSGVRVAFRRNGVLPADLNAVAAATSLATQGRWRFDPFGAAQDLGYTRSATSVLVRSRGVDRTFGTADDVQLTIGKEPLLRDRQRARLRLLRAQLLRSPYRLAGTMSAADRTNMRQAMLAAATARRQWLTATPAERAVLTTTLAASAATLAALQAAHSLPPLPSSLTGTGGLMQQLGTADTRAADGQGAAMRRDTLLGMVCIGADAAGGTDDDM
jgi:hypothetical protein